LLLFVLSSFSRLVFLQGLGIVVCVVRTEVDPPQRRDEEMAFFVLFFLQALK